MLLKAYLSKAKLSDTAFAEKVGVGQATISRYHGGRFPTIDMIIKIHQETGGKVTANDHVRAYCEFHGIELNVG